MNPSIPTPRPGSSWYYASLHTQPAFRADFLIIYGFYKLITDAARKDVTVANAKLNWWAYELQNLNQAQHPLSKQLKSLIDIHDLDLNLFLNFIHSVKKTAESFYFVDQSDFLAHCGQFANLYQIIARIQNKGVAPDFAQHVGIALTQIHFIRDIGFYLKHHKIVVPQTVLQSFELESADLLHPDQTKWVMLMQQQATQAREYYQKAFKHGGLAKQLNLLVLLELQYQVLNEVEKDHFAILNKRYHLTPLRKWWLAQKLAWRIQ